jgi:xanthosine utilization system XapX-like protein
MPSPLSRALTLVVQAPAQGKLAYCLLRDGRAPAAPKLALLGVLGLVASPVELPRWVPLRELDAIALALLALRVYIDLSPEPIVAEHRAALAERRSLFDEDLRTVVEAVRAGVGQLVAALRRAQPAVSLPAVPKE